VNGRPDDADSAASCSTTGVEVWAATVDDGVVLIRGENRAGPGPKCRKETVSTLDTVVCPLLTIVVGTLLWIEIPLGIKILSWPTGRILTAAGAAELVLA